MIFCTLLLLLFLAFFSARVVVPVMAKKQGSLHTFAVDPPTLLIVGLVASLAFLFKRKGTKLSYDQFRFRKRLLDLFLLLFLAVFWFLEGCTYFDLMGHPFDAAKTGNDFMWNGYLDWLVGPIVDTTVPTYTSVPMTILAAALMALQLPFLLLGRRLGLMTAYFNDLDNWSRPKTG